jgi:putative oxidoreductase
MRRLALALRPFLNFLTNLTPLFDLLARLWIAYIFLLAGFNKVINWDSTILLFTNEYHVPLLSPYLATVIGTFSEIILSIFLMLGFGGRICIFIFFLYNLVAMISYPELWTSDDPLGLYQHISWGLLLGLLMCHGPGKYSIDYLLHSRHKHLLD